jgi:acetyl-CoA acetyltransferase
MITAAEALDITQRVLSEEDKRALEAEVEKRIRAIASAGGTSLKIEQTTDVAQSYLRGVLTQAGFQLSDIGLTIYW